MQPIKKICAVTGSRGDFWLIKSVLQRIKTCPEYKLQLIVTASHLCPRSGYTVSMIEEEGFEIDEKIETLVSGDTPASVCKTMGLGLIDFGQAYDRLRPDLILIPGDRYEMLSAASAALVSSIPIAHLYGGDITEGSYDDMIRHALTKMAHLHFVTNSASAERVIQMGEHPSTVFNVGSPALDFIVDTPSLTKTDLQDKLGIVLKRWNLLITMHPETRKVDTRKDILVFLEALDSLDDQHCMIFTAPNADTDGLFFLEKIRDFVHSKDNAYFFEALGQKNYNSLMRHVDMVIGNSSSGLYEAPSFRIPTVNVGHRQSGRLKAQSVIDAPCENDAIVQAIEYAKTLDCSKTVNPYGDGQASHCIVQALKSVERFELLLRKKFYEIS